MSGPYAFGERLEAVVVHHARRTPEAVALEQATGQRTVRVTYGELAARAAAIGTGLRASGVGPGDLVPVRVGRSPELVAVLLGVLWAGAVYIALDPAWPRERVADVVRRSGAELAVVEPGTTVDDCRSIPWSALAQWHPETDEPSYADGTATACVFYTSGSTGRPKGVLSPHRGTIRTLVGCPTVPLAPDTVFLQAAPLPWDGLSLELWAPLLNGGRCVLLDRGATTLDAEGLRRAVERGVNSAWLTSSLFNLLVEEAPELLARLRLLLVGGERVSVGHARTLLARAPELHLVNGYGPAESTIFATTHLVRSEDVAEGSAEIPIGRPVPRTGVVLLNAAGRPLHGPATGEIAISGDGLAAGYLGDADETARRFLELDGVRHYRTGDLAERDADGVLRYRGRSDRQFKVRGVRIEPGEVEAALETHPDITSCCVLRVETAPGRTELSCLYTTSGGDPLPAEEVRTVAARRLLPAMVPTLLVHTRALPLGPTGKTDQAAAARLVAEAVCPAQHPNDALVTGDELLAAVRELLGAPALSPGDDLAAGGMTSLDAVRLAARVGAAHGVRLTVADVYRAGTLAALRERCTRAQPAEEPALPVPGNSGPAPLSHAQQRFWMAEQSSPGDADNLIVLAYLLTGTLNRTALEQALQDVVARHPALRTLHPWSDEVPEQQALPAEKASVPLTDRPSPESGDVAALARMVTLDWWSQPLELEDEIPLRVRLCRVDDRRHLLCLQIHHIAFDGWSESVLLADLAQAYAARAAGTAPDLPPTADYADYSRWEHARLDRWVAAELPFWQDRLEEVPPPVLPGPPPAAGEAERLETVLRVAPETVAALTVAAGRHGGPPVAALLAATGRALARTFDAPDVALGTVTDGRTSACLEGIVGYFVNPLVVPLAGARDLPAGELLTQAVEGVLCALEHRRVPFDELVRRLRPARGRHPWFQAWSVLQRPAPHGPFAGGLTLEAVRVPPPTTALELMLEALPQPDGGWNLVTLRRADGMSPAQAALLADEVDRALAELTALA